MLLRVRVTLPDRPGSLGQVARTLGVAGADIVQVTVLERFAGRAVDDFTVVWPGAARLERLLTGLAAVPGVRVDGVWRAAGAATAGGHDAEVLAQLAGNPADGLATLVDAAPGLFGGDWAAVLRVSPDWADGRGAAAPSVVHASWQAPQPLVVPEVAPLRARGIDGPDGVRYAAVPFGRAGLVLLVARSAQGEAGAAEPLRAPAFHRMELDRAAQLVRAAAAVLGDRLAELLPAVS
jgi:hypothetical protein